MGIGETTKSRLRMVAGPAVRRTRRELQWRRCGDPLHLDRAEPLPYEAFRHSSPLFRPLSGVQDRLQRNKVTNLRLAIGTLDGRLLRPGERLSFWYHVGSPTRRRGFLEGLVLDQGRLTEGVGGGLCQLTNLLYWMTLHTPLTVVERWRHTCDVFADAGRTQPFGTGATCAYPVLDLQIRNATDAAFRLGLSLTDSHLQGVWTTDRPPLDRYEVYEAEHLMTNDAPGIFSRHNVIRRRIRSLAGDEVADELVATNHALMMYQPFLPAGGDGGPGPGAQG